MFQTANYIEAGVWVTLAVALLAMSLRREATVRRRTVVAALAFVAFGLSDIVEARTGAWWRPWWLLLWKAGILCVLVMVALQSCSRQREERR